MALICITPVLGFSPTLQDANYPYLVSTPGPTPQVGSTVQVIDTEAPAAAVTYDLRETGVGTGIYGWLTGV